MATLNGDGNQPPDPIETWLTILVVFLIIVSCTTNMFKALPI